MSSGIAKGQLVRICEFTDKSEQLIVSVETIGRYSAEKDYGNDGGVYDEPRRGRVHFWLGKEGMKPFDRAAFEQMFERVFVELPPLTSAEQRHRFVQANYPHTPLADLVRFTGLSPPKHPGAALCGSFSRKYPLAEAARAACRRAGDGFRTLAADLGSLAREI